MARLIDKSEVIKRLCAACYNMGSSACISCVIPKIVKETPTIEAEPVRHGHWNYDLPNTIFTCSECFMMYRDNPKYCPRCGAKMDT